VRGLKEPSFDGIQIPPIIADSDPARVLEKLKKSAKQQYRNLQTRLFKVLKQPSIYDKVYTSLNRLLRSNNNLNLGRGNPLRKQIRKLALKRFALGYPPRKPDEISLGDAINWEWIIYCAKQNSANVAIVTRDSDYGTIHENQNVLNDWLRKEFHERVGQKTIQLYSQLSEGLKAVEIKISPSIARQSQEMATLTGNPVPRGITPEYVPFVNLAEEVKRIVDIS
jgi:hypothetical protein